jgi:2-phospho-L-lactate/phosphoenolpyruvate guanylyltransferase
VTGIWAVLPVKEFEGAKQRLASCLTVEERRALATIMLEDVLDAVSPVRELAGVLVVTIDPAATSLAARYGARIVTEGAREGHTGVVTAAARLLVREGQAGMMTMPGDIPRLKAAEIAATLAAHRAAPASPSSPRMTISDRTRSSARRRTPFRYGSERTAFIRISMRRELMGSSHSSFANQGSGWTSIIPSTSSRSSKCRRLNPPARLPFSNNRASPAGFWR